MITPDHAAAVFVGAILGVPLGVGIVALCVAAVRAYEARECFGDLENVRVVSEEEEAEVLALWAEARGRRTEDSPTTRR